MSRVKEDLVGLKNNRLTVLEMLDKDSKEVKIFSQNSRNRYIKCLCDCGNIKITKASDFKNGSCKSCGCLLSEMAYNQMKKYCKYDLISNKQYGVGTSLNDYDFIFDKEDYELIKNYGWNYHKGYLTSPNIPKNKLFNTKKIFIHRLIMNCFDKDKEVDHINHNVFDNRKINLRIVTKNKNMQNRSKPKNNKSGTKGVCFYKGYWTAYITFDGNRKHLGAFKEKEKAIEARLIAEEKYFGEYSYINSINKNIIGGFNYDK